MKQNSATYTFSNISKWLRCDAVMNSYLCPQVCTASRTVMLPHGYALTWTWTDNLTTNNETGAIFLHLLLLYVWKMTTAPYGWCQLQITLMLVTLITNKPPLIIHVLNNLHTHDWTKNDCTNTAETTIQLPHRFLAIVPPCTKVMAKTLDMCLVIITSDKQNIHKKFLNTEFHSLAQNCVNVANIFITCYFVTWHFCKHKQTVWTYIHTITHKIFLLLKWKVDNQIK
jgi:hypothetical protein